MALDDLNLLTFRLIILTLPAQYVLEIWNGAQSAVPAGVMIAVIATAMFSIAVTTPRLHFKSKISGGEVAALIWFAVLGFLIIIMSEKTKNWRHGGLLFTIAFFFWNDWNGYCQSDLGALCHNTVPAIFRWCADDALRIYHDSI